MADPTYPLFSIFSFLGFVLALVPLPWHFQAWNAGTCIYMMWASLSSFIVFVDSLVWRNNINKVIPVWCDITTKFLIGAGVGIPASSLCINRRLYKIASTRVVTVYAKDKRNAVLVDLGIAVGIPVLVMVLHVVVQGHRFNILEDVGCIPTIFNTPAAYVLVWMWPVLLGCISFVYATLAIRAFLAHRIQFHQVVSSTKSLTVGRYLRLLLLASIEMLCTVPLTGFSIWINNDGVEMSPYVSWANVHWGFSQVERVPSLIWRSNQAYLISVELGQWIWPICALLFFSLFGFAEEARKNYRRAYWAVAKRFGFEPPSTSQKASWATPGSFVKQPNSISGETLPPYAPSTPATPSRPRRRPDSLTSSLAESVDLEKGIPDTPFSLTTLGVSESMYDAQTSPQRSEMQSDLETPISSPTRIDGEHDYKILEETAEAAEQSRSAPSGPETSVPPYHRPFTPPVTV